MYQQSEELHAGLGPLFHQIVTVRGLISSKHSHTPMCFEYDLEYTSLLCEDPIYYTRMVSFLYLNVVEQIKKLLKLELENAHVPV